ncbi:MAG TPA: exodeoxyribonuclease VII large subunit, partial [Nocardioides sp.]|nr:exodeoxyribonuclease VII large subunit [Nocardioides sp.]
RARVQSMSPLATLQRGYPVLQDADGRVVTSVRGVAAGATLSVRVADGRIHVTATETERTEESHE